MALVVLIVGALLGRITVVVPFLLGVVLLSAGAAFLSSRVNPLSTSFYLNTKPSWTAVGAVFLSAIVLLVIAYEYFVRGLAPVVP